MKLYFITGNENKLREVKEILTDIEIEGLNIDLDEIQGLDPHEIIKHKLNEAKKKHPGNFIVEDVSLSLDCLNGLPGPLIKWFLKSVGIDGITKIAKAYGDNKCSAKCIIGLNHNENIEFFEGIVKGNIVESRGQNNFGWDPIFRPEGYEKTYAEMNAEEKNKISHRRLAFEKLRERLNYL